MEIELEVAIKQGGTEVPWQPRQNPDTIGPAGGAKPSTLPLSQNSGKCLSGSLMAMPPGSWQKQLRIFPEESTLNLSLKESHR